VHEHIARAVYYLSIHLLFASLVAALTWALTSVLRASATTKYWIWVATAFNFALPLGAIIDKLCAPHLMWAKPLAAIGGPVWDLTQSERGVIIAGVWLFGTSIMLGRLIWRILRDRRELQGSAAVSRSAAPSFLADGIPVSFREGHHGPTVQGLFYPRIQLPAGINRLLDGREFRAVLTHELAHARRRDNLLRLLYEIALCILWFQPLIWLAGARMALYRELSCDEAVKRADRQALVSALAKLAVPEQKLFLQATAASGVTDRLAYLAGPAATTHRAASLLLTSLFAAALAGGILQTIAHTACCFTLKR
jgi:beta-lactamase regulating signal transducer with metallopeptidase domain